MTLQDNVARGAAWLDTEVPGWAERIDLSTLDLRSSSRCVAGQLFGNPDNPNPFQHGYAVMMDRLREQGCEDDRPDVTYGFTHPDVMTFPDLYTDHTDDPRITELRDLWLTQIAIRTEVPEDTP